ncbi:hypothetical protein HC928_24270 [bacterium]|nr:hypothetical protein [bacterium]
MRSPPNFQGDRPHTPNKSDRPPFHLEFVDKSDRWMHRDRQGEIRLGCAIAPSDRSIFN